MKTGFKTMIRIRELQLCLDTTVQNWDAVKQRLNWRILK